MKITIPRAPLYTVAKISFLFRMRGQDETGRVHIKQVHYHILKFYIVVAGTDLWVYNAENLCVSFFNQVASIFCLLGKEIKKKLGLPTGIPVMVFVKIEGSLFV